MKREPAAYNCVITQEKEYCFLRGREMRERYVDAHSPLEIKKLLQGIGVEIKLEQSTKTVTRDGRRCAVRAEEPTPPRSISRYELEGDITVTITRSILDGTPLLEHPKFRVPGNALKEELLQHTLDKITALYLNTEEGTSWS